MLEYISIPNVLQNMLFQIRIDRKIREWAVIVDHFLKQNAPFWDTFQLLAQLRKCIVAANEVVIQVSDDLLGIKVLIFEQLCQIRHDAFGKASWWILQFLLQFLQILLLLHYLRMWSKIVIFFLQLA